MSTELDQHSREFHEIYRMIQQLVTHKDMTLKQVKEDLTRISDERTPKFAAYVHNINGESLVVNSLEEYQKLIDSKEWFSQEFFAREAREKAKAKEKSPKEKVSEERKDG